MRVATVDIGTNSVLLLVAEARGGALVPVDERATITRLGQGVDQGRALAPEAVARTLGCLEGYAAVMSELGVERRAAVATSAMRDARNGHTFLDRAEQLLGVRPEIASGPREAALTFSGALVGLAPPAPRLAVFDVGGGSTEIIVGSPAGAIVEAVSLDVGAVRLTERFVATDPPSATELEAVRGAVRAALAGAPALAGLPLVGVAGTVTSVAALAWEVAPYDAARVHGSTLSRAELEATLQELAALTVAERRALPALDPKRADVIVAGALIVSELCRAAGAEQILVSDRGVRWGLAQELAGLVRV